MISTKTLRLATFAGLLLVSSLFGIASAIGGKPMMVDGKSVPCHGARLYRLSTAK